MTCKNCGSTMEEGDSRCSNCGFEHLSAEQAPAPEGNSAHDVSALLTNTEAVSFPFQGGNPGKKRVWIAAAVAFAVLVAATLTVLGVLFEQHYQAAAALYDSKQYAEAAAAYAKLGSYKDSALRAELSQNWADYTRAADLIELFDHDDTIEAQQIFLSLGDFEDAPNQAVFCQNRLDYDAADALETAGDFEGAQAAFEALGEFNNARERARYCSDTLDYAAACALIEQGEFTAAAEQLAAPSESGFEDATDKLDYCVCKVDYAAAQQLLADGKNYDAYKAFLELDTFEDSLEQADCCVLDEPKNGELYHNEHYNYKQTELSVVNSYDEATFLKLYSVNGDLVCSFYISAGKSAKIRIPAGTYTLNRAFGTLWFGPEDMFGDDGTYYRQLIGESYEFTLKSNYIYTISAGTGGTPVEESSTDRDHF